MNKKNIYETGLYESRMKLVQCSLKAMPVAHWALVTLLVSNKHESDGYLTLNIRKSYIHALLSLLVN